MVVKKENVGKVSAGEDIDPVVTTGGNEIGSPNICADVEGVFRTSGEEVGVRIMVDGIIGADVIGETGVGTLAVVVGRIECRVIEGTCMTLDVPGVMEPGAETVGDDVDGASISPVTGAT